MLYAVVTGARENERTRIICQTQFSRKNMLLTWKKVLHKTIQGIKKENGLYKNGSYLNFCPYIYDSYSSQCVNIVHLSMVCPRMGGGGGYGGQPTGITCKTPGGGDFDIHNGSQGWEFDSLWRPKGGEIDI